MERTPAGDARAAPSASEPNDTVMGIPPSPKRSRDPAQGNMVSQTKSHPECLNNQQCLRTHPIVRTEVVVHTVQSPPLPPSGW
eukprot:scaffold18804_cov101-Isochrysis_galbana.AAC.2